MNNLEELLRETVTDDRRRVDPPPSFYDGVRRRATRRRHRQLAAGAAAVALVAVTATGGALAAQGRSHPVAPAGPSVASSDALRGSVGTSVALGGDKWQAPMDVVATSSGLYVLTTNVIKLDATGTRVVATAPGPAGTPSGLAVDGDRLWVWSQDIGQVRLYDANSLQVLATFEGGLNFFSAAAIDGNLWLAANEGLYMLPSGAADWAAAKQVIHAPVYSVAADPARHRVLVGEWVATAIGKRRAGWHVNPCHRHAESVGSRPPARHCPGARARSRWSAVRCGSAATARVIQSASSISTGRR